MPSPLLWKTTVELFMQAEPDNEAEAGTEQRYPEVWIQEPEPNDGPQLLRVDHGIGWTQSKPTDW